MKNFLQNLLIVFALALCAIIALQWTRETSLRKAVQELTDVRQNKEEAILNLQATQKRLENEIQRLDGIRKDQLERIKTNEFQISGLTKDLDKATNLIASNLKQIEAYKDAVDRANESIKVQNETIKQQNAEMQKLAEDRNEMVKKFNKMAADYNELAQKWNKQQDELAQAATNALARATNAPAKK
jgi:chromosome segregation ATPase